MVCAALEEHKGNDVAVLDVKKLSSVTDYFILATGLSPPHIKALADETLRAMRAEGVRCRGQSGTAESLWIALDFIDVVVHVFSPETRSFYALDELWSDAERLSEATQPAGPDADTRQD